MIKTISTAVLALTISSLSFNVLADNNLKPPAQPKTDAGVRPFPVPSKSNPTTGLCAGTTADAYTTCYMTKIAIPGCQEFKSLGGKIPPCTSLYLKPELKTPGECAIQEKMCDGTVSNNAKKSNPNFSCGALYSSCVYSTWYYKNPPTSTDIK